MVCNQLRNSSINALTKGAFKGTLVAGNRDKAIWRNELKIFPDKGKPIVRWGRKAKSPRADSLAAEGGSATTCFDGSEGLSEQVFL